MVNVDIAGGGPSGAVERRVPATRNGSAGTVGDDVGSVTLQDGLTGVAASRDSNPVLE